MLFKEGIPGIFYERKYGEFSRIYGFAKLHMLVGDSHVVSRVSLIARSAGLKIGHFQVGCPISMTDGCARGELNLESISMIH